MLRITNKQTLNFLKRSFNIRHALIAQELSNRGRSILYSVIVIKFPVNQFSCLSLNFHLNLVISIKVSIIIEESVFKA